ncbi:MAG TPA: S46 family peptidase [Bacteroidales bacterium]|nr:S46 family peptidase [Bacteroidales bacterium]
MKRFLSILGILILTFGFRARADEGMWLLPLIEKLNIGKMTQLGLKLSAEDIYSLNQPSLKDAIVIFGGGCTGEIVSSQGLILTNHHCGYGQIQAHSTVEHDYLKNGFWAMSRAEELPNPGLSVTFLVSIEDVTDQVLADVKPGMSGSERLAAVNSARVALEKKAAEGNNYRISVASFYGGNYFYLLKYERYNDVRLVGAPPQSIGKFGSDTDNWEWPRHTVDFSVFRVYAGPDGKPAPYSKDNVPLNPKKWLPVSIKDLKPGDYAMILGYPGRTNRYMTSWEVNELLKITHPNRIKIRGIKQDVWMEDMKADPKVNIQYSAKYFGSSNYWKYSIGQKRGLERLNVLSQKEELEKQFDSWIASSPQAKEKYGEALNMIRTATEGRAEYYNAMQYLTECMQGCEIFSYDVIASTLEAALQAGDQSRITDAAKRIKDNLGEIYKDYNAPTDLKATKAMLKLYRTDVPAKFHPDFFKSIIDKKYSGSIDRFVDDMFAKSILPDTNRLKAFLAKPSLKALQNDPAYLASKSVDRISADISKQLSQFDPQLTEGKRLWMAALMEMAPEKIQYPDANSTMRLTYGTIQPYDPRDGVTYKQYTTMAGMLEKYKPGDYEFDLPQRLIDLYNKKEFGRYASPAGYMPVGFLTTNDITGGNSGSPVINANGELIGLAFDGNWESMSGDIAFDPELKRTIAVDVRCVLWVMDIYAGAGHLVKEMTIVDK